MVQGVVADTQSTRVAKCSFYHQAVEAPLEGLCTPDGNVSVTATQTSRVVLNATFGTESLIGGGKTNLSQPKETQERLFQKGLEDVVRGAKLLGYSLNDLIQYLRYLYPTL
jgi:hypothetical protein